jgi:hypothetical protein
MEPSDSAAHRADSEHLRILSILHYIMGGLTALGGLSGLMFLVLGGIMASGSIVPPQGSANDQAAMQAMGAVMSVLGLGMVVFSFVIAAAIAYVGYCLPRGQAYLFCMVVAVVECISFPLGTALGVFTIIVLLRDTVKSRFAAV